ncbi:MAG: 30S ribosomal protein S4 [Clostridia bacterium]|nr:30S ribosomal protein S4 [Clostridiales bacterium]MBQ7918181.1 30S ribosomal protein S4 [Clostridia bacterium]
MAKYINADCRLCRREGTKLFLKGERCTSKKCALDKRPGVPGMHPTTRKKPSQYALQLREKQKVKRAYGLLEKQFHGYYEEAERMKGKTGETMLSLLERRLDNVCYRLGLGSSRAQARQIVNHTHILVNGKKVNIPSYQVKVGDVISVKETSAKSELFAAVREARVIVPKWLEFDPATLTGKIVALPAREDIDLTIAEHLIIELYSK